MSAGSMSGAADGFANRYRAELRGEGIAASEPRNLPIGVRQAAMMKELAIQQLSVRGQDGRRAKPQARFYAAW